MNEYDTEYKDDIICPHCGGVQSLDEGLPDEDEDSWECDHCDLEFKLRVIIDFTFSTSRITFLDYVKDRIRTMRNDRWRWEGLCHGTRFNGPAARSTG